MALSHHARPLVHATPGGLVGKGPWLLLTGVLIVLLTQIQAVVPALRPQRQTTTATLQATVQAEAEALVHGDLVRYLTFQDDAEADEVQGHRRFQAERQWLAATGAFADGSPTITHLTLGRDRATVWVGFQAGDAAYARVQAYQRVHDQWRRVEPDNAFWGEGRELRTAHFRFLYHEPEETAVIRIAQWAEALYANLNFALRLHVDRIAIELQPNLTEHLYLMTRQLTLPSPLLVGAYLDREGGGLSLESVKDFAYLQGEAQHVLDTVPLALWTAAPLADGIARLLAADVTGLARCPLQPLTYPLADAAAHQAADQLLPRLQDTAATDGVLKQALSTTSLTLLSALWDPCRVRTGQQTAIAQPLLRSLIAFAEEQAQDWHAWQPGNATSLLTLFVQYAAANRPDDMLRAVYGAARLPVLLPVAAAQTVYRDDPDQFFAAWHAWLVQRYG